MKRNEIVGEVEGLVVDGDSGFVGVNQLNPGPGEVVEARNARFVTTEEGEECGPRLGVAKLPWTNRVLSGATTAQPFAHVWGAGEYRDADDLRWVIIAADGKVFRTREGSAATELTLPAGTTVSYDVSFTQTVNGLVMFRGKDLPELLMESLDLGFGPMPADANGISGAGTENPTDGTELIPNAASGEWIGNRLFVPYETNGVPPEKDLVGISDYLNATRYKPVRSQGRINQGSSDRLVRLFKFNENQGLAFKGASVYVVSGIKGDLTEMALDELTNAYGLAGRRAVAHTGKDVWYLAPKVGIASVSLTDNGKFQGVDVPVSATMQRVIERIDWRNGGNATFAYWNNRMYCAVPLDDSKGTGTELVRNRTYGGGAFGTGFVLVHGVPGATYRWVKGPNDTFFDLGDGPQYASGDYVASSSALVMLGPDAAVCTASVKRVYEDVNNAVLVFDFLKQHWAGVDDGPAMMVKEFFKSSYQGQERLFFLSVDGFINLVEELYFDEVSLETTTFFPGVVLAAYQTVAVTAGESYAFDVRRNPAVTAGDLTVTNGSEVLTIGNGITRLGAGTVGSFVAQGGTLVIEARGTALGFTFDLVRVDYTLDTGFIDWEVLTRPYRCEVERRKQFLVARPELRTWYPKWSMGVVTEGMGEETTVKEDVTRDATVYEKPAYRTAWDRTNTNDDHGTERYRQDYSVVLGETTTPSGSIVAGLLYYVEDLTGAASIEYDGVPVAAPGTFTGVAGVAVYTVLGGTPLVYGPGNYIFAGENGLEPELHQAYSRPVKLPKIARGKQLQVRMSNDQGRCCLVGMRVEGVMVDRRAGSFV